MPLSNFVKFSSRLTAPAAAAALAALFASSALAGGYNEPQADPLPMADAPSSLKWSGIYAGGSLGYAFNGDDKVGLWDSNTGAWQASAGTLDNQGALARVHVGQRWQLSGGTVLGTQLGLAAGNVTDSSTGGAGIGMKHKLKHAVFLRSSVGRELGDDMLGYVTAGLGYGKFDMTRSDSGASASYSSLGYTVGAGVEKLLGDRLSVFGEYEYANFGKKTVEIGGSVTKATPQWHSVNVGLNYRF